MRRTVEPLNMDAGLSDRMQRAVEEFAPPSKRLNTTSNVSSIIDLSTAQNETLRPELVEFFKSTVEDKATSDVRSNPKTYMETHSRHQIAFPHPS